MPDDSIWWRVLKEAFVSSEPAVVEWAASSFERFLTQAEICMLRFKVLISTIKLSQ